MVDFDTLDEWLEWQSTLSPREIDLGLERVARVSTALGLIRPPLVITIGGTNGKGSTVAMLESLVRMAGHRVGAYTSPHLVRYNERIRLDGVEATDTEIVNAFRRVEAAREGISLTYFEYGTLGALAAFESAGMDVVLLEVGLGGRLDATNIIDADGVIITSISLDHEEWLGDSVASIAREKAGIMRAGRPAVFGGEDAPCALAEAAAVIGADLRLLGRDFQILSADDHWQWRGRRIHLGSLPRPAFGGREQVENAAAVLALAEAMGRDDWIDDEHVRAVLSMPGPPGRQQRVIDGPEWWLDVAHNTEAARALARSLAIHPVSGTNSGSFRTFAIIGMLADKDAAAFTEALSAVVDEWLAVPLASARARPVTELAAVIANTSGRPCRIEDSVESAIRHVRELACRGDRVLIAGSFFLVGPALETLGLYSRLA